MFDFASVLKANPAGVFATQDGNKLKTRVFQYLFADGKKVYFCTNCEKPVYKQLQANPNVSFCTYPQNFTPVLSVNGKAVFVEDIELKNVLLTRTLQSKAFIKHRTIRYLKFFMLT